MSDIGLKIICCYKECYQNTATKMTEHQLRRFGDHFLQELDDQCRSLSAIHNLSVRQSLLLQLADHYHLRKTRAEKQNLLQSIKEHKKKLLDFQTKWLNLKRKREFPSRRKIQQKIAEMTHLVRTILAVERQNAMQLQQLKQGFDEKHD